MRRLILFLALLLSSVSFALPLRYEGIAPQDAALVENAKNVEGSLVEHLDNLIRKLMLTGRYEKASVFEAGPNDWLISAVPLRVIGKIEIQGNKNFSESDLLAQTGLTVGDRFERAKAVNAAEKLKGFLGEAGYYDAVVEAEFPRQADGNLAVLFHIDEREPCRIEKIQIQTENPKLQKQILESMHRYSGRVFSETLRVEMQQNINSYLSDHRYLKAALKDFDYHYNDAKTKITLIYTIDDPYQYDIIPVGLQKTSVIEFYQSLDVDHYERNGPDPIVTFTDRIKSAYLSRGFAQVQLKTEVQDFPKEYLRRVRFLINEGPQVELAQLNVSGRISRPASYYSSFIIESSSTLVQLGYYSKSDLENGFKNLVTELKNQGFLKAKVQSWHTDYSRDKKYAYVEVVLDEGPQTEIRQVDFEGTKAFSPLELSSVVSVHANSPLHLKDVESSVEQLRRFYWSRGYIEMKVLNSNEDLIEYNEHAAQTNIHFRIFEGPQVRVAKIVVDGNTFTHTDVVTREISIHVGDILTQEAVDESTVRLNKFGIFSRVEIRTLEENTNVSNRTVIIIVTERDPGVFRYGGGINSSRNFTVRGFTGLSYNNLGGTARGLSGRVELNYNVAQVHYLENKISAGYFEPFLFDSRTRGRINYSRSEFVFYYEQNGPINQQPYTIIDTSQKIDFLLERDLTRRIKLTWTLLGIDQQFTWERNGQPIDITDGIQDSSLDVNYIGPTLDFDYRDSPFMPTKGWYFRLDSSYADPLFGGYTSVKFLRTEANFTHYLPVNGPRWVWTNCLRGGYESNLNKTTGSGIPASYGFFLGGYNTIRGFDATDNNERIPPDYELHFVYPTQLIIPNNSYYYLVKTELRYPIFGDFGGVIFYDGGGVGVTDIDFRHPYRQSVGFGFRLNTPVGPAALDIAFKIDPILNAVYNTSLGPVVVQEAPFRVHFYIGTF